MKMETTKPTNEERKWIRLQEVGIVLFLMVPVSILIVGLVFGFTIRGPASTNIGNVLVMLILALVSAGYCCLRYGDGKRQELKDVGKNHKRRQLD